MYDGSNRPIILFATPPRLDELHALTICLSASAQSVARFQPQVIKCREFIFTEPEVIGTPSPDINDHCFHLVAKVSFMNAGKLQARLSRIGLQATKPYPVSTELYESCLRYTLLARLSPSWNKAGPWLIQGRDFLTHRGCANAVKMNINVSHNELFFTLEAAVLKLAPLQVTDLDIIGKHLEIFLTNPAAELDHDSIASDWCFILPSMKRGRIVHISHEIPDDSPFKTYRDLKRHWKNTYGYRLPEYEDDINFYQIRFGPLGGKLFTYPEVCLRGRELQKVARVDPKPILRAFMQEIQSKFPTVCGCPIKLQSKAKFPVTDLLVSDQDTVQNQPNLSNKMNSSRPAAYRTKSEIDKMLTSSGKEHTPLPTSCIQRSKVSCTELQMQSKSHNVPGINNVSTKDTSQFNESNQEKCLKSVDHSSRNVADATTTKSHQSTPVGSLRPITNTHSANFGHSETTQNLMHKQIHDSKTKVIKVANNSSVGARNVTHTQVHGSNTTVQKVTDDFGARRSNVQSNFTSRDAMTPRHSSAMTNQTTVPRRLFPQFTPKKMPPVTESAKPPSTQKIVPIFHPQKKLPYVMSGAQVKVKSAVHKAFISHTSSVTSAQGQCNQTSTKGQGHQTSTQGQGLVPSFVRSALPPYSHKDIPVFTSKVVPSFQKAGTPCISSIPPKKLSARAGKEGKEQKEKKAQKRPKGPKKENQGETKRAKKLKKAEA